LLALDGKVAALILDVERVEHAHSFLPRCGFQLLIGGVFVFELMQDSACVDFEMMMAHLVAHQMRHIQEKFEAIFTAD